MNLAAIEQLNPEKVEVEICLAEPPCLLQGIESEIDEMWSYVNKKDNQRWLWHAIDHATGKVLAYVFGTRNSGSLSTTKSITISFWH